MPLSFMAEVMPVISAQQTPLANTQGERSAADLEPRHRGARTLPPTSTGQRPPDVRPSNLALKPQIRAQPSRRPTHHLGLEACRPRRAARRSLVAPQARRPPGGATRELMERRLREFRQNPML